MAVSTLTFGGGANDVTKVYYYYKIRNIETVSLIFNNGEGEQTADYPNVSGDSFFRLEKANNKWTAVFDDEATAVENIAADNAPVEYYNLQGVKVNCPENGIFIKKQGNKATKVIL